MACEERWIKTAAGNLVSKNIKLVLLVEALPLRVRTLIVDKGEIENFT